MSSPWKCNKYFKRVFGTVRNHIDRGNEREYAMVFELPEKIKSCKGVFVVQDLAGNRTIVDRFVFMEYNNKEIPIGFITALNRYAIRPETFVELLCLPQTS